MATHPYISGAGNITQMIGFLRKTFPQTVTADSVKKLGLASKNESYVINVLQFLGLIGEDGKRTELGHKVMTIHDETEFQKEFESIVREAYADLFSLRGDDAWTMSRDSLIGYFRSADKTSDIIGSRQAGVFLALRELAGHKNGQTPSVAKAKPSTPKNGKPAVKKSSATQAEKIDPPSPGVTPPGKPKSDMALTVRIEINLPAEGSQETYDAIFKSIKANLFP